MEDNNERNLAFHVRDYQRKVNMEDNKTLDFYAWIILLLTVLYVGGHFVVATANGWDGLLDYGTEDTGTDIEINTGTRETVENSGLLLPGSEIQITDSEGETTDVELLAISPDTGGPVQIEVYDSETNEYYDLEMNLR